MKERPILFSAPMVRAILEGRKTMTRRMVKPQPPSYAGLYLEKRGNEFIGYMPPGEQIFGPSFICPYGIPGDRLWVKETWHREGGEALVRYRATGDDLHPLKKWKSSRFMPRSASRILLEITDVRVERLQEISEDDVHAEGCNIMTTDKNHAQQWFRELWESINGPGSWGANPWVWVVCFKRVK